MKHIFRYLLLFVFSTLGLPAAEPLTHREWTVDGVQREALIYVPAQAKTAPTPLVFVFHGHGGRMQGVTRSIPIHELWPEALVVFMQGLNTPGRLTDPEGKKPGWQSGVGAMADRDVKFFDAVLASLKADYQVNPKRLYSTGHSNGAGFTYLLWAVRGDLFAAMAPSSSGGSKELPLLKPKPVMHIAGENDPLVKFAWQKATMDALIRLNECAAGRAWEHDANCTLYPSAKGNPVVTAIHPGDHTYHRDAPPLIVKFFKDHELK